MKNNLNYVAVYSFAIFNILISVSILSVPKFTELGENRDLAKKVIENMLLKKDYLLLNSALEVNKRPNVLTTVAETSKGRKFLKLHTKKKGLREYLGGLSILQYLPAVVSECVIEGEAVDLVVQPYIESISSKILFNYIENSDYNASQLVDPIINHISRMTDHTLDYVVAETCNDALYIDRLDEKDIEQRSGRIEEFYVNKQLNLFGLEIAWNEFLDKHIVVDGIAYKETLRELLSLAKNVLNKEKKRLVALCHGDLHEMNIYVNSSVSEDLELIFLDCEYAGINDFIGDSIVFIIYNAVLMAYLAPKYFADQFFDLKLNRKDKDNENNNLQVILNENSISLQGINKFGTSSIRKAITARFINNYLDPILSKANILFKIDRHEIEQKIKACIILRLLGVYNISLFSSADQVKVLGLLFKVVATPIDSHDQIKSVLARFYDAL
jgi:Choline/ethanolamine kinase